MLRFFYSHALELIALTIELIVLFAILREVRELKRHQAALRSHEQQLAAARPLMSTLYTGDDEIMDLAVEFTEQASAIYAMGTLSSLVEIERHANETIDEYDSRMASVDGRKRTYIAATLNKILSGCTYRRVMDFAPQSGNEADVVEALANVNFFLRAFDTPRTQAIDLELYHNAETIKGRGDFHFRCSDRQLVLRVGGHGNGYANAAILINDTRVIEEFRRYFDSIVVGPATRHVSYKDLEALRSLLQEGDVLGAKEMLELGDRARMPPNSSAAISSNKYQSLGDTDQERNCTTKTAVVLAAGRGSRMGHLTDHTPKCMLPFGGRPLLAWSIDSLNKLGVERIYVLVGYQSDEIIEYINKNRSDSALEAIRVSPISTAEALLSIKDKLNDQFWFMHANIVVSPSCLIEIERRYLAFYRAKQRYASAALATVPVTANLTHAVLLKTKRGEARIANARRWDGNKIQLKATNLLSLGVGLLNGNFIDWNHSNNDDLMIEGLIRENIDHPVLSIPTSRFIHLETEADYRRWYDDPEAIERITKSTE
jgi:hypothetical protein